jgi:hypothetical protein
MSPWLRRCALVFVLLSLPALAGSPREDRRSARIRNPHASPPPTARTEVTDGPEVEAPAATPVAVAAVDPGGVDLAGLVGMIAALAGTLVYARGRRFSTAQSAARGRPPAGPPDLG